MENRTDTAMAEVFRHPGLVVVYAVSFCVTTFIITVFDVLMLLFLCARSTAMELSARTVLCGLFLGTLLYRWLSCWRI